MSGACDGPTSSTRHPVKNMAPARLHRFAAEFDTRFEAMVSPSEDVPGELLEAIRHTALAPGKRIRPFLVVRCCELAGGKRDAAWPAAAAIECIHVFSLIHDDLPAMDDDDFRRGQPSCHKKFGEATAILAGDALVVLAFELLVRPAADAEMAAKMVLELTSGAGWSGMIGGQAADILGQSQPPTLSLAEYIHQRKTARLFETACRLGAIAGQASTAKIDALGHFGQMLGRAFQIVDDLLDVQARADDVGKRVGKDAQAGKQSFPRCVGIEGSREAARAACDAAVFALNPFGNDAADLCAMARYVVGRDY